MEKTNGNDPINPSPEWVSTENREHGLTKREYFAAMAMHGLLSSKDIDPFGDMSSVASQALIAADAIITTLNTNQ